MNTNNPETELSRDELDALPEAVMIEFGATWCGHCQAAQPLIAAALAQYPQVRHIRIEDGPGRKLGRSFRVKLWPTLIVMRQGQELARLVRPAEAAAITEALALTKAP
jgi:thioredoxin 1